MISILRRYNGSLNIAIGLAAMATMMQQVLFTRLFSVTLSYHYAFLVISLTMVGLTAGALITHCCRQWIARKGQVVIAGNAALLAGICMVVALIIQTKSIGLTREGIGAILGNSLLILPGFTLAGITVTLLLTCTKEQENIRYAFDLCGAALGCIFVLVMLNYLGVLNSLLFTAGLYVLAAYICGNNTRRLRRMAKWGLLAVLLLVIANAGILLGIAPILRLHYIRGLAETRNDFEVWNSYSRITVKKPSAGEKPGLQINIDEKASTWMRPYNGNPKSLQGLASDVRYAAYHLRPIPSVMVIGVGGGADILAALANHVPDIHGLEMNNATYRLLTDRYADFSGNLATLPGVHLVNAEARSYMEGHKECFGYIEIGNISTWAATSAGAFILSESALYTIEGWQTFWHRLNPNGLMSFMRPFHPVHHTGEIYRTLALTRELLNRESIERPEDHVIVVMQDNHESPEASAAHLLKAVVIISKTPISRQEFEHFTQDTKTSGYQIAFSPFDTAPSVFRQILTGTNTEELEDRLYTDLSPATDDRAFFFQMLSFRQSLKALTNGYLSHPDNAPTGIIKLNLYAIQLLFYIFAAVTLLVLAMLWPLHQLSKHHPIKIGWDEACYFTLIGFGFMLLEIGLLQRLTLFLGHPTYALSVVLSVLLLASGIGSRSMHEIRLHRQGHLRIFMLCAVLIVITGISNPVLHYTRHLNDALRISVAVALLAPLGFFMGMAMPFGMYVMAMRNKENLVPWLWGINCAASVIASILAIIVSIFFGTSITLWLGVGCYVLLYALIRKKWLKISSIDEL